MTVWQAEPEDEDVAWHRLEGEQTLIRQHVDSLVELHTCKVRAAHRLPPRHVTFAARTGLASY